MSRRPQTRRWGKRRLFFSSEWAMQTDEKLGGIKGSDGGWRSRLVSDQWRDVSQVHARLDGLHSSLSGSKTGRSCSSRSAVSAALHPFVCPDVATKTTVHDQICRQHLQRHTGTKKKKLQKWRYRVVSFRARETLRVSKNHLQSNRGDRSSPGMRLGG